MIIKAYNNKTIVFSKIVELPYYKITCEQKGAEQLRLKENEIDFRLKQVTDYLRERGITNTHIAIIHKSKIDDLIIDDLDS